MNNLSSNTPTIYSNAFSRRPVRIWLPAPNKILRNHFRYKVYLKSNPKP